MFRALVRFSSAWMCGPLCVSMSVGWWGSQEREEWFYLMIVLVEKENDSDVILESHDVRFGECFKRRGVRL